MPSEDEIRRSHQERPVSPAVQELLANIPEFDPRHQQIEEFQRQWMRTPPEPDNQPSVKDSAP